MFESIKMGRIEHLIEKFVEWLRFKDNGEMDIDRSFQALFLKSLAGKEASFAIFGIRCNSKESTGKRKMDPGRLYQFLQGYTVDVDSITVEKWRMEQNTLYDDYYNEIVDGKPHIQISAIVGQNGAGKSSIIEFMMRLINNFAAASLGERQLGEAAERLHFIDKVDGELWYMLKGMPYHLRVKNAHVTLSKFGHVAEEVDKFIYSNEVVFFNNKKDDDCTKVTEVLETPTDVDLRMVYPQFFYTIISNQSVYAYNTLDFYTECNDDEKEWIAQGLTEEKYFNDEQKCWLHGIFHKNDGYKTPILVTPYRYEGNININNENLLAIERLVTLLANQPKLRRINGHLLAKQLTFSYNPDIVHQLNEIHELGYKNLTETGFVFLRKHIIESWQNILGKNISDNLSHRPFFDQAIDYIVYKTLKVAHNYEQHHSFFESNSKMTDSCDLGEITEMVKKQVADYSHITRKIFQTIAYLWYEVYDLEVKRGDDGELKESFGSITFDDLGKKWQQKVFKEGGVERNKSLLYIQRQALIVPPFLCMRIDLCETDNPKVEIDFETLSSGEKQQIYSISSILYHLDNLRSAHKDESNPNRICYKNVNVVLEEIELYYHPELQQQFVSYLIDSLDQVDLEGIECIHVIIVTHSPYVLSDIPKSNVLALRKDNPEPEINLRTFGANIHDMLKNSFFLTEGSIGKFAQWEVGHILACLEVHRWALMNNNVDTKDCPLISEADENEVYKFLERYLYADVEHQTKKKFFSYEYFCQDLSIRQLKDKIQLIDEPVLYQILMRKLVELEKEKEVNHADA